MKNFFLLVLVGILVASGLFAIYFKTITYFYPMLPERGQFGDMFGGLNAFFSSLAFLGIIYTIWLQKKELGLQREELRMTRDELQRTAEAQEKSEKALSKQAGSLKITAKLNGKSAILEHYNALMGMTNSAKYGIDQVTFNSHKQKADEVIREINKLIEGK